MRHRTGSAVPYDALNRAQQNDTYIIYHLCGFVKPFPGISVQIAVECGRRHNFLDFCRKIMYNEFVWIADAARTRGGCGETAGNIPADEKEKQKMMNLVPMTAGFAYLDPAVTSYLVSIGVGVAVAAGTAIGIWRSRIKRALKRKSAEETVPAAVRPAEREKDEVTAADLLSDSED